MIQEETLMVLTLGFFFLSAVFGFVITVLQYKRLHRFVPRVSKEYKLDPAETYLISGNGAKHLELISFTDKGIRNIIITNYWIPKLSLLKINRLIKYQEIDYALRVPRFHFSFVLKDDVKSLFTNPLGSRLSIDLPRTYNCTAHTFFNFKWLSGVIDAEIKSKLEKHSVKIRLNGDKAHTRRNNYTLLAVVVIAVIVTLAAITFEYYGK